MSDEPIFSGDDSRELWRKIDALKDKNGYHDLWDVIYLLGCKLQQLEARMNCTEPAGDKETL